MKTKKYIKQYLLMAFITLFAVSCFDNVPEENELPRPPVDFTYRVIDENYQLDFFVYATVQFTNTSTLQGTATWDFGDGSAPATGDVVTHNFLAAGLYQVQLTVAGQSQRHPILISDIVPILTLVPSDDPEGIHEVLNTPVIIEAYVPQPRPGMTAEFYWIFPEGTYDYAGNPIEYFDGRYPFENGGVTFSSVGSQLVRLQVRLDGRLLEEARINVPIALDTPAPTVYFAVRNANVQALKIPAVPPAGVTINPFDMGVHSGRTPFNILFNNTADGGEIFLLDAGARFTFQNVPGDARGVTGGDGRIRVMSADGMRVGTFLTNNGHAFNDPFFGFIHEGNLYFSSRNRGVMRFPLTTRDRTITYSSDNAPWFFANHMTGWRGRGIDYGNANRGFLKHNDVWWWGKNTFMGSGGIFRFTNDDIFPYVANVSPIIPAPAAGMVLAGVNINALLIDANTARWPGGPVLYFTTTGPSPASGLFRIPLSELGNITAPAGINTFRLMIGGQNLDIITDASEGLAFTELIGISQLALDEATGNVYFGFRSANENVASGLMRVNFSTGNVEHVLPGVEGITGVTINNTPRRLF